MGKRYTSFQYFANFIAIGIIAGLIFGAKYFKQSPTYEYMRYKFAYWTQDIRGYIGAYKHNVDMLNDPPRKPPLTFLENEGALELWLPDVFGNFGEGDWEGFWALIYETIEVKEGRHMIKRYRTRQEVQSILRDRYYDLSYLRQPDWNELWGAARVSW